LEIPSNDLYRRRRRRRGEGGGGGGVSPGDTFKRLVEERITPSALRPWTPHTEG
jgi:hypothetical protein